MAVMHMLWDEVPEGEGRALEWEMLWIQAGCEQAAEGRRSLR